MPRRPGHDLSSGAVLALLGATAAAAAVACTTNDGGTGGCQISRQTALPASPLTMLPEARLDAVADGYMLSGVADHGITIRWAALDGAGAMGQEQRMVIAAAAGGPWLAFTSDKQPGDTLLVAQAIAKGADAELRLTTVPAAGAPTPPPGPALAVLAGAAAAPPPAALAATRTGSGAVLAWVDPASGGVQLLTLSPAGQAVGTPVDLGRAVGVACLGFALGKKDLTLLYYRHTDATSPVPTLVITELVGGATVDSTLEILLDSHDASCPQLVSTEGGYALAFQDAQGSWLGTYLASTNRVSFLPFVSALAFGGAAVQPPIAGLTTVGADFAVVFSRIHDGELWRASPQGIRLGVLPFPSVMGSVGGVSTQVVPGGIMATYADYTSLDRGVGADGSRIFLGATCL